MPALLAKTPVASEKQTKTSVAQASKRSLKTFFFPPQSNGPCDTSLEADVQRGKTVKAALRDDKAKTTFSTAAAFDGKRFGCIIH